jgi:hypothetical protein
MLEEIIRKAAAKKTGRDTDKEKRRTKNEKLKTPRVRAKRR